MTKNLLQGFFILFFLLGTLADIAYGQDEPPLPYGLKKRSTEKKDEPPLPAGLSVSEEGQSREEPVLPEGLSAQQPLFQIGEAEGRDPSSRFGFDITGFWEVRIGARTQKDPFEKEMSLGEMRLQLEREKQWERATFKMTKDYIYDPVFDHHQITVEKGEGWSDLRELNFFLSPVDFLDMKLGRQILTWGTGDLLFINDLFPKDWNSFFIGRDPEYLKAPSDAFKVSFYSELSNMDIIYIPRFDADRYIDGRRISYWNPTLGRMAGRDFPVEVDRPDDWFDDNEIAFRFFKNIRGYEMAFYSYDGFWKSPGGIEPVSGAATFPKLSEYGFSTRGVVSKGIGAIEMGYYDSREDRDGTDPFVRNSEFRFLVGYEEGVAKNFIVGLQYYLEHMMKYESYENSLPLGARKADEDHHVLTLRLTKLIWSQNGTLSLFTFYSPSDNDGYLRPKLHYKIDDQWAAEFGGNVFLGEGEDTFFGQFQKNSNAYAGLRYSF